jgi:hypothetical protein
MTNQLSKFQLRPAIKGGALLVLFALVYFIAVLVSQVFLANFWMPSAFLPASGLLLAALLLSSYRLWLPILVIAVVVQISTDLILDTGSQSLRSVLLFGAIVAVSVSWP